MIGRVGLSPKARAYLADWLDWTERGAPDRGPYYRRFGLCFNAQTNCVKDEFINLFELNNNPYPFGKEVYIEHRIAGTQHLDPNRLAFVRANLPEGDPRRTA